MDGNHERLGQMPDKPHPVVFIHGLWLHPTSWAPWESMFEQSGYRVLSPGWPGDQETVELARANPDSVADKGIDDVVEHFASIIADLDTSPVLIGHSFGGMIAEKLLGQDRGAAAIAIDAAQIKGVLPLPLSALRATLPVFKNPANRHRSVMLTAEQFHYSFGNTLTKEDSDELYEKWVVPSPGKPLFEAAAANFSLHSPAKVDTRNPSRGPLLLIMGGQDHTVPEAITKSTLKQYRYSPAATELLEFGDRGHSLTIDAGSGEVAKACLSWLNDKGL
jgi:pimeloyl-ACP methyl ester carboxylesterase